jgi:uncharacterized coiled-coil protein SlyX
MDGADDDGRWMTFAELSQARGISEPSARKLVRRHKWRRQAGNQGIVRILVPAEALDRPKDGARTDPLSGLGSVLPPSPGTDPRTVPSDTQRAIVALEAAISALREQLDLANGRADRAEIRADAAEKRADGAENRADRVDQALAGERTRADELRDRLDGLTAKLADAQAELAEAQDQTEVAQIAQREAEADAAELRQAQAVRQDRGRWARLRAAWRRD